MQVGYTEQINRRTGEAPAYVRRSFAPVPVYHIHRSGEFMAERTRKDVEVEMRGSWAGHILLNELHQEEWREIMWAALLTGALTQVELAAEIGVTIARLHPFLHGASAGADDFEMLELWCVGKQRVDVVPERVAVRLLARHAPRRLAYAAQARFASCVRDFYLENRTRVTAHVMEDLEMLTVA